MKLITAKEAADKAGVTKHTLRRYCDAGIGPAYLMVGERRLFDETVLDVWIEESGVRRIKRRKYDPVLMRK